METDKTSFIFWKWQKLSYVRGEVWCRKSSHLILSGCGVMRHFWVSPKSRPQHINSLGDARLRNKIMGSEDLGSFKLINETQLCCEMSLEFYKYDH